MNGYQLLINNLDQQTVVLTANRRQATYIRTLYDRHHQSQEITSWPSTKILPFSSWLIECWQNLLLEGIFPKQFLLNQWQAAALWQKIIADSSEANHLLNIASAAQLAQQARQLLKQWQVDINPELFNKHFDAQIFLNWVNVYDDFCLRNNFIDIDVLANELIKVIKTTCYLPAKKILFTGFDLMPPIYQALLNICINKGSKVQEFYPSKLATDRSYISFTDRQEELLTMACWAKKLVSNDAQCTVACVIPNLTIIRPEVETLFSKVFFGTDYFNALANSNNKKTSIYNISSGRNLLDYAMLTTAFNSFTLNNSSVELVILSSLLRSPYLAGSETEMEARAELDVLLHNRGELSLSFLELQKLSATKKLKFTDLLNDLHKLISMQPKTATPSQWAQHLSQQLAALGWPGQRELNSEEFQLLQKWQEVLAEFASLDLILGNITLTKALHRLKNIAKETIFQSQSQATRIEVLGALEASGLCFDYLWVTGLQDDCWPEEPKPNPFIPIEIQKRYQMPHASPERELYFSKALIERFSNHNKKVIFSYPENEGDRKLRKSALIKDLSPLSISNLSIESYQPIEKIVFQASKLEIIEDLFAPPLENSAAIRGGTYLFKHQAACPFRAFALLRLKASDLTQPQIGLSAIERGSLIHKILEQLWQKIKDQTTLKSFTQSDLMIFLDNVIEEALQDMQTNRSMLALPRFKSLEKQRLTKLLMEWLALETQRSPFQVMSTESSYQAVIGTLPITISVDRIDELTDGTQVIIDYKTGITSLNDWFGERPEEPQLPIYCITNKAAIQGLLFAQVHQGMLCFKGICSKEVNIPGVKVLGHSQQTDINSWLDLTAAWRDVLEELARQFSQGWAAVDPKNSQACQFCDLPSLCRISEINSIDI